MRGDTVLVGANVLQTYRYIPNLLSDMKKRKKREKSQTKTPPNHPPKPQPADDFLLLETEQAFRHSAGRDGRRKIQ